MPYPQSPTPAGTTIIDSKHQYWCHRQWMNNLFSDKSRFCLSCADDGVRFWRRSGERYAGAYFTERDPWGGPSIVVSVELELPSEFDPWFSKILPQVSSLASQLFATLTKSRDLKLSHLTFVTRITNSNRKTLDHIQPEPPDIFAALFSNHILVCIHF